MHAAHRDPGHAHGTERMRRRARHVARRNAPLTARTARAFPEETWANGGGMRLAKTVLRWRSVTPQHRENTMSNGQKRSEGLVEEVAGKIKGTVGKVIGNEQMEAEGKAKELKGEAKQEAAKAGERVKGKIEEVGGAIKNRIGAAIDNEQMQAEGKAKELKGEARQAANKSSK